MRCHRKIVNPMGNSQKEKVGIFQKVKRKPSP